MDVINTWDAVCARGWFIRALGAAPAILIEECLSLIKSQKSVDYSFQASLLELANITYLSDLELSRAINFLKDKKVLENIVMEKKRKRDWFKVNMDILDKILSENINGYN